MDARDKVDALIEFLVADCRDDETANGRLTAALRRMVLTAPDDGVARLREFVEAYFPPIKRPDP